MNILKQLTLMPTDLYFVSPQERNKGFLVIFNSTNSIYFDELDAKEYNEDDPVFYNFIEE